MFQYVLAAFFGCVVLGALLSVLRGHLSIAIGLFWVVVGSGGIGLALNPDALTRLAQTVGIGRGVNLLLYCAIVAAFVGFLLMYIRVRRVRSELTLLVRRMAIMEAESRVAHLGEEHCSMR